MKSGIRTSHTRPPRRPLFGSGGRSQSACRTIDEHGALLAPDEDDDEHELPDQVGREGEEQGLDERHVRRPVELVLDGRSDDPRQRPHREGCRCADGQDSQDRVLGISTSASPRQAGRMSQWSEVEIEWRHVRGEVAICAPRLADMEAHETPLPQKAAPTSSLSEAGVLNPKSVSVLPRSRAT
jgi:hypothetical protein